MMLDCLIMVGVQPVCLRRCILAATCGMFMLSTRVQAGPLRSLKAIIIQDFLELQAPSFCAD